MVLFLTLGSLLSACRAGPPQESALKIPASFSHLASGQEWLNTSRPLQGKDLSGRIVLIDFWTYCCINCIHVMPELKKLEQEFGDGLTVLGVHSGKFENERNLENIRAALLRYGLEHPVVNDPDFKIWNDFSVHAWPTLILLDPEGKVVSDYSGEGHGAELREDILRVQRDFAGKYRRDPLPIALERSKEAPSLLRFPGKLTEAPDRDTLFISDSGQHRILGVSRDGQVTVTLGARGESGWKDGDFASARFNKPQGLLYREGKLYVADTGNHLLRVIDLEKKTVATLAGTGRQGFERSPHHAPALQTPLASPWDLAFYPELGPDAGHIAIAMAGTHQLWSYDFQAATLDLIAGNGRESIDDGPLPENSLSQPSGLSALGAALYFVDSETSSLRLLKNAVVKTLIGTGLFDFGFKDGKQGTARMQHPLGLWAESDGVYIADSYNHAIRFYDSATGMLSTVAGTGKPGAKSGAFAQAEFNEPNDVIRSGGKLYVADTNNHRIQILDPATRQVSTFVLRESGSAVTVQPSESLPNVKIKQQLHLIAGKNPLWKLSLPPGWKVNQDAPSHLQLFREENGVYSLVASFGKESVATRSLSLPPFAAGNYRLQGVIYHCREGSEALCFIASGDAAISVGSEGGSEILWTLHPQSEGGL